MLSRDSEDEMWSRFVFELVMWPQKVTLARWTQPSGPLCLWQCFQNTLTCTYQDESVFLSIYRDQQECQWTKGFEDDVEKYDIKRKRMKNWGKTGGRLRTDRQRDKHETPSRTSRGKLSLNDGHSWFLPSANNVLQVLKLPTQTKFCQSYYIYLSGCYIHFSPYAEPNQPDVWPRFRLNTVCWMSY